MRQRIITGGGSAGGHIAVLATTNPGLDDPADPQDIDTSVVAYLLFNPAFSPDDAKDEQVDALRHVKPGLAPAIVFFGTRDPWKPGWDAVHEQLNVIASRLCTARSTCGLYTSHTATTWANFETAITWTSDQPRTPVPMNPARTGASCTPAPRSTAGAAAVPPVCKNDAGTG